MASRKNIQSSVMCVGWVLIQGMEIVKAKKEPAPDFVLEIFERTKEAGTPHWKRGSLRERHPHHTPPDD